MVANHRGGSESSTVVTTLIFSNIFNEHSLSCTVWNFHSHPLTVSEAVHENICGYFSKHIATTTIRFNGHFSDEPRSAGPPWFSASFCTLNPFTAAISVMLNAGPHLFFFTCSMRYWRIPLRGNLYTAMCIWRVLLVMRVADSTFHDESYSSPVAKGLIITSHIPYLSEHELAVNMASRRVL